MRIDLGDYTPAQFAYDRTSAVGQASSLSFHVGRALLPVFYRSRHTPCAVTGSMSSFCGRHTECACYFSTGNPPCRD